MVSLLSGDALFQIEQIFKKIAMLYAFIINAICVYMYTLSAGVRPQKSI